MKVGPWSLRLLPESRVTPQRRILFALLTVASTVGASWNDFSGHKMSVWALIGLGAISLAATLVSTAALGRLSFRHEQRFRRNLQVLRGAARPIPQRRDALLLSEFTGRETELKWWKREHARLREMRGKGKTQDQSPVILAMHGPPGVGKSTFAHVLCRELAKEYPHGLLVANFGTSGTARGAADITRDLLLQLGWPERDMPSETEDRVATLRSLTRDRRILFLFDAVRDHDQVTHVMPSEPGCAVIITSRREIGTSLGLPRRPPITTMNLHDSLKMLSAISGVHWTRDAETAVEIVEMCARLPLAIRSAAERIRDGQGMRYVAASLRPAPARLEALDHGGRSIRLRIKSEFDRLGETQRRALTLLASLDSDSFVPWVLRPLMPLKKGESTALMTDLAAAQFVQEAGTDPTGQARYRIEPLTRLYALGVADAADVTAAGARFDGAYTDLIDDALKIYDPETYDLIRSVPERRWRSPDTVIAPKIAANLDQIVPREYLNLVRILHGADIGRYAPLMWRVAALLDGRTPSFPPGPRTPAEQIEHIKAAFERGIDAARACGDPAAEIDVRLAQAQFLITVDHYREAVGLLETTARLIAQLAAQQPEKTAALTLRLVRVRVWLQIEIGAYGEAYKALAKADGLVHDLGAAAPTRPHVKADIALVRRFNDDLHRSVESLKWEAVDPTAPGEHDIVDLHGRLAEAEELRRKGYWDDAASILRDLLDRYGDARGHTSVHYRLALLRIDHALHLDLAARKDSRRNRDASAYRTAVVQEAIEHAAACIVTFGSIGDPVGQLRGRALLARALVLEGDLVGATQLDIEIKTDLDAAQDEESAALYLEGLRAQYHLAHADVEIIHGRLESGWHSLIEAVHAFRRLEDWTSHADAWRLLHEVYARNPDNRREVEEPES